MVFGRVFAGLLASLSIVSAGAARAHDAPSPPPQKNFETYLAETAAGGDFVGLAVAVVRGGEVDYVKTFGTTDINAGAPVDENTVFRIASVSKGVAASIVSQLIFEDKASLSAPVLDFAPEFRLKRAGAAQNMTLEHALSHRTSLPPYAYDNLLEAGVAPTQIRRDYAKVDPICPVGACYAYQNVAFDIAANVVEWADARSYSEAAEQRLFAPLGMARASIGLEDLQADENWARPHRRKKGAPWRAVAVKEAYYRVPAAGGVNASITDLAIWLKAQMGHAPKVLSTDMLALIHKPRVATPAEVIRVRKYLTELNAAHYGLGWRVYDYGGETIIAHAGSVDGGYGAHVAFVPGRDIGIAILTNSRSKAFGKLLPAFLADELSEPAFADDRAAKSDLTDGPSAPRELIQ